MDRKSLETVSVRLEVAFSRLSPFSAVFFPPQEKVKAVFDNLIQLEHLNIVKFHKYWADVKENRARVGEPFSRKVLLFKNVFKVVTFVPLFAPLPAGDFHHRVHVFRKSEAVLEKDKEKPQDHEREGATARTGRSEWRRQVRVFKAFPFNFKPAFASDRPGNAGAHRSCLRSGESTVNLQRLFSPPRLTCILFSAATCTPASPPSSTATSPVTPFSSSTTASLRLAQVGVMLTKSV